MKTRYKHASRLLATLIVTMLATLTATNAWAWNPKNTDPEEYKTNSKWSGYYYHQAGIDTGYYPGLWDKYREASWNDVNTAMLGVPGVNSEPTQANTGGKYVDNPPVDNSLCGASPRVAIMVDYSESIGKKDFQRELEMVRLYAEKLHALGINPFISIIPFAGSADLRHYGENGEIMDAPFHGYTSQLIDEKQTWWKTQKQPSMRGTYQFITAWKNKTPKMTNWADAFNEVINSDTYDLAIMVTDGEPTNGIASQYRGQRPNNLLVNETVGYANKLKAKGIPLTIVAIGKYFRVSSHVLDGRWLVPYEDGLEGQYDGWRLLTPFMRVERGKILRLMSDDVVLYDKFIQAMPALLAKQLQECAPKLKVVKKFSNIPHNPTIDIAGLATFEPHSSGESRTVNLKPLTVDNIGKFIEEGYPDLKVVEDKHDVESFTCDNGAEVDRLSNGANVTVRRYGTTTCTITNTGKVPVEYGKTFDGALKDGTGFSYMISATNKGTSPTKVTVKDNMLLGDKPYPYPYSIDHASQGTITGHTWTIDQLDAGKTATAKVIVKYPKDFSEPAADIINELLPEGEEKIVVPQGHIKVNKTTKQVTGKTITYQVEVKNPSQHGVDGVRINDIPDANHTSPQWDKLAKGSIENGNWVIGTMKPGETLTATLTFDLISRHTKTVTNTVKGSTATIPEPKDCKVEGSLDADSDMCEATSVDTPPYEPVKPKVAKKTLTPGSADKPATYQVEVKNPSHEWGIDKVEVTDILDDNFIADTLKWENVPQGTTQGTTWNVGDMKPGETLTANVSVQPTKQAAGKETTNTVKAKTPAWPQPKDCKVEDSLDADSDMCDQAKATPLAPPVVTSPPPTAPKVSLAFTGASLWPIVAASILSIASGAALAYRRNANR